MTNNTRTTIVLISILFALSACSDKDKNGEFAQYTSSNPIPRSMPGDKGKYYLLKQETIDGVIHAISSRIGPSGPSFSSTEKNCAAGQMREIGASFTSPEHIKIAPTDWFDPVKGSSKADLFTYLCK